MRMAWPSSPRLTGTTTENPRMFLLTLAGTWRAWFEVGSTAMWPAHPCRPLGPGDWTAASAIEIAENFGDKVDEGPGAWQAAYAGGVEHVHRHGLGGLPIRQDLDQTAGHNLRPIEPIEHAQ